MNWLEAVQAAIIILNWLKEHPPSNEEISQEELDEANAKMKAAIEKWQKA